MNKLTPPCVNRKIYVRKFGKLKVKTIFEVTTKFSISLMFYIENMNSIFWGEQCPLYSQNVGV